jgi:hypothetical protein
MTHPSGRRWWQQQRDDPIPSSAPESLAPSPPLVFPQPRDARGRFARRPGERSVISRKTGCELWVGPFRGGTPWEDGRAVLVSRYEARYGPLPPGHRLVRICKLRSRCVNLDHAIVLTPGQAQVYRYASKETVWLDQAEADALHTLIAEEAARLGISFNAAIAYARWPYGLAEALPDDF